MQQKATFPLSSEQYRGFAKAMIDRAPKNWICVIQPEKRTNEMNKALWAKLNDVANTIGLEWAGQEWDAWGWKDIFMSGFRTHQRKEKAPGEQPKIIGGIEGELLPMGLKTSELTKEEFSELLAYIDHWGTERGVIWTEPKPKNGPEPPPPETDR